MISKKFGTVRICEPVHNKKVVTIVVTEFNGNKDEFINECKTCFHEHTVIDKSIIDDNFAMLVLVNPNDDAYILYSAGAMEWRYEEKFYSLEEMVEYMNENYGTEIVYSDDLEEELDDIMEEMEMRYEKV